MASDPTQILLDTLSINDAVRRPAEQMLNQAKESSFHTYIGTLIGIYRDESKPGEARQAAGLQLKNSVAFNSRQESEKQRLTQLWTSLSADIRTTVKNDVLQTLASPTANIRQTAALIIANFARIELPANQWPDLLELLTKTAASENPQHVDAAVTTLGYICEEAVSSDNLRKFLEHSTSVILGSICTATKHQELKIRETAMVALVNATEISEPCMKEDGPRDTFMRVLCENSVNGGSEGIRQHALEALSRVVYLYYNRMDNYMQHIFDCTFQAMQKSEQEVMQALEVWISIYAVEADLLEGDTDDRNILKNYGGHFAPKLVPVFLHFFQKQDESADDNDWNPNIAAHHALAKLAEVIENDITGAVMPFVQQYVVSPNWREREAALMAFGSILGGANEEAVRPITQGALPQIVGYVCDGFHPLVSDTAAWVLSEIASHFPEMMLTPEVLPHILGVIAPLIQGDSTKVSRGCKILDNLFQAVEDLEEDQPHLRTLFSASFVSMVQALLQILDKDIETQIQLEAHLTLCSLLNIAAPDVHDSVVQLIPEIIGRIKLMMNKQPRSAQETEDILEAQKLNIGALVAIQKGLEGKIVGSMDLLMEVYFALFNKYGVELGHEVLRAIGGLAIGAQGQFMKHLDAVKPYIIQGLNAHDNYDLCAASVGCVADIADGVKEGIGAICNEIMSCLGNNLLNKDVSRDLKPQVVSCLGDIALHIGGNFKHYIIAVMEAFLTLNRKLVELEEDPNIDDDMWEFAVDMRVATCEAISSIFQGMKTDAQAEMWPFVNSCVEMINFVARTHSDAKDSDRAEIFTAVVSTASDLLDFVTECPIEQRQMFYKEHLRSQTFHQLFREAASRKKNKALVEAAKWGNDKLQKLERGGA